ncbi:MAG TPA: ABC transporter substrate-binding protein [Mycobacteriales bacterium]|nr:ABC transporter substrate-binding protein [Mycobacteriales bacterium]
MPDLSHRPTRRSRGFVTAVAGAVLATLALSACGSSSSSADNSPAAGGSGSSGAAATGSPIKIGTVGTFGSTGSNGTAKASAQAVQAWASSVNAAGGLDGHPVQVFAKDDQGEAAKSLAAVKDLVENEHVVAIVGQHEAGLEQTWQSYVDAKKIPVIGGSAAGAEFLTDPNFYPVTNNPINTIFATIYGAKLAGKTSFGAVYCAEFPACKNVVPLGQSLAKKLGLSFSGAVPLSGSATDYTAQCLTLRGQQAAAVFTATQGGTSVRFIDNCRQQGYSPLFINNPQNWTQDQLSNSAWDGVLFTSDAPLWFGDGPGTAEYLAAVKKYQPDSVLDSSGTAGWYAAKVFQEAVEKSGATGDITAADVTNGMHALGPDFDLDGALAPVTYAAGKPAVQQSCGWYMAVKGGQETAPYGYGRKCAPAS